MKLRGKEGHRHGCGHGCFCVAPEADDCRTCRLDKFNAAQAEFFPRVMAKRYEDSLSTTQLLEHRA